jgi:hypothetical protein
MRPVAAMSLRIMVGHLERMKKEDPPTTATPKRGKVDFFEKIP